MRATDAQANCHLAGRIVGHGARIVVMGPDRRVVSEPRDFVDLVFRLHVAVLGDADKDAHPLFGDAAPIEAPVDDGLVGTVNGQRSRPRPAPQILFLLIAEDIAAADSRQYPAHVARLVIDDARAAFEEALAKLLQIVAVRRGQPDARNHDAVSVGQRVGHERIQGNV